MNIFQMRVYLRYKMSAEIRQNRQKLTNGYPKIKLLTDNFRYIKKKRIFTSSYTKIDFCKF